VQAPVNGLNVFGIPTAGSGQSRVSACGMSHRRAHVAMPITGELQGWQFRVDVAAGGLRPWSGQTRRGAILARVASMLADAASSRRAMLA
jgi:hypothetical protein